MSQSDIRLSQHWQLTRAADGDIPLCTEGDALYQSLALEAVTQTGDLFFDLDFGWGLHEFINSEDTPLVRLELASRARERLLRVVELDPSSISVGVGIVQDTYRLSCHFRLLAEGAARALDVVVGAVTVEVEQING